MKRIIQYTLTLATILCGCGRVTQNPDHQFNEVPGFVVTHEPATSGVFVGAPSILTLPGGDYLVSLNYSQVSLGDRGDVHRTAVFSSSDKGKNWKEIASIDNQRWSTIFSHRDALYLIGTDKAFGNAVIRKSTDNGKNWTTPTDAKNGLLAIDGYHCAPVPVVIHHGRIWRAYERQEIIDGNRKRKAVMLSAPVDADLLDRKNWTFSNELMFDDVWHVDVHDWIEGNAVVDPDGNMVIIIRVERHAGSGPDNLAAMIRVNDKGDQIAFDPETSFIQFPGGSKKFTIRFDTISQKYWSLVNWIQPADELHLAMRRAGAIRNTLALISSDNLERWIIERVVLHHPDVYHHAFQYVDWLFEKNDIIAVSRTAYDDGIGGAHNYHDANFITFHRIENFRYNLNMKH